MEASVPRPVRELKGFASIPLEPGESRIVTIDLQPRDFSFYDVTTGAWKLEPGQFRIEVAASARDIRLTETLAL